ncbi:glycosyl transferase family 90-domain-containing protein [Mycena alexandri]|uniref:Glycosyl transferase family 90-domain-containing protein n=1 Tax=Mycena alexandri TaxID=1745969 RepID=A0AAD6TGT7_9AGAR|nr:glycosyl transferase family 90-domain-containing protein [Mycena alexandri]
MPRIWPRGSSALRSWRYQLLAMIAVAGCVLLLRALFSSTHMTVDNSIPTLHLVDDFIPVPTDPAVVLAQSSLDGVLKRQSTTLAQAVARYSLKAGRPPPPNFDGWFEFARKKQCLIDDYDQIQRDFEPFYQLAADQPGYFQAMIDKGQAQILQEAFGLKGKQQEAIGLTAIRIINGKILLPPYRGTTYSSDLPRALRNFAPFLPDLQFLLNGRDEPRVIFNYRELSAREHATNLTDEKPFHLSPPYPTADFFKNQSGCDLLSKGMGFMSDESANVAFLRSSSSSDFTTNLWPILSMTKISPCFSDILFPGQYHYYLSRWSSKLRKNDIAWADKKPLLYWRGASNGGRIIGENYRLFPRFRLIDLARKHAELMDVKMTTFVAGHCKEGCDRERIVAEYNITGKVDSKNDVLQYKYALDVDGNTFSGRFLSLLKSGSLVFKSTVFEEYFNDWLRPYEHYIPVKPDLSDLAQMVEWAIKHDDEARRIQETGRLFGERVMTDSQNDCYLSLVLLEWARLQSYGTKNATAQT